MVKFSRAEPLVFVPNQYCNFGCKYCYLGDLTKNTDKYDDIADKLNEIIDSYTNSGIAISEISFHGAEVTTLPYKVLDELFTICNDYFTCYYTEIYAFTRHRGSISIKTNLYYFDKYVDLFKKHRVFVSGSVDIPFSHHENFRVLKSGKSTLEKVKSNIVLMLKELPPFTYGLSATLGKYALDHIEEFIENIEYMDSIGYDICNQFYVMFIYDSAYSKVKIGMTDDEMVYFMNKLLERWH